jgi:hypothetical protein
MKKLLIATLVLWLTTAAAFAAEPADKKQPSADDLQQILELSFGAMAPMMGKMTEAVIDAQLKIAEKPETAKSLALFKRNLFNELIKQGFTKKEAFDIMLNTSMPAATPGMK